MATKENKKTGSEKKTEPSQMKDAHFPIVGIGASAGGLEPTKKLLEGLPEKSGLAFVIIQHLAETHVSLLPEILSRTTKIPIQKVETGTKIEPDHIFVIPAGVTMTVNDNMFVLKPRGTSRRPIDEFFYSIAAERKHKAIGIVLSGSGSDGTDGLRAIKAEAGITFAQDPRSAQYPEMPLSVIAANLADFVLPPEKIADELLQISKHPNLVSREIKEKEKPVLEDLPTLQKIFSLMRSRFNADFEHYKRSTIIRRISRRVILKKLKDLDEYEKYLEAHSEETQALFDDMLIGVTHFFREPTTFAALKKKVFPELLKGRSQRKPFRLWIPGCSTGEEVYSLAIELQDFFDAKGITFPIQVFGTDLSERNIEKARKGIYPKTIEENVSKERLAKYFIGTNGNYQIAKRIRDSCVFALHDITKDPPFSNLDLIICRNVLIYFDSVLQEKVLTNLFYGLKPSGYLVLGEAETTGKFANYFIPLAKKGTIFLKKTGSVKLELPVGEFGLSLLGKKEPTPVKPDVNSLLSNKVDGLLMAEYVPATFIINNELEVVGVRGKVQPYITMEPGAVSYGISKIVQKQYRPVVQSSIFRARKEQKDIQDKVLFSQDGFTKTVKVHVTPILMQKSEAPYFIVLLEDVSTLTLKKGEKIAAGDSENTKDKHIVGLSEALESTKQTLQTTVEQQEATNEELRSAMEEIQSSNEELQSTNEELETTKEELQSNNEELSTVNSELKDRNSTLMQLSDDLNNLLDNVDAAIIIVDRSLKIRRFTNPAQEFLRLIPSDVGRKIADIRINLPVNLLEEELSKSINSLQVIRRETKGDNNLWYQLRIRPYVTEEKKIEGAVLTIIDINDLKKTQEELLFQADLLANVQDAVIATDKQFKIVYWSKTAQDLFGWTSKEAIGQPWDELFQLKPEDLSRKDSVNKLLSNGVFKGEASYRRKDGVSLAVDVRSNVLKVENGELLGAVTSIRDISDRKRLEKKLEDQAKSLERVIEERTNQLREAERLSSIGQTAGMVGHDIRNPLQAITSDLYLVKTDLAEMPEGKAKEGVLESLEGVERNIEYINKIVQDLQDYARPNIPVATETDLEDLCQKILNNGIPENIDATCKVLSNAKKIIIDPSMLQRMLSNLVNNSIQAMPNGGKLEVSAFQEADCIVIEVEDTGVGIPEEVKPKLFTPLFTTKSKGQGFGLAVVKRLTEALGGTITYESEPGKGTKFIIRLPSQTAER